MRRRHIRAVAERTLAAHRVEAGPVPVEDIVRACGVVIRREPAPDDLSGFIVTDERLRRTVIGVNRGHPPNRQRFTLAHELGHFLLHEMARVHVDRGNIGFQVRLRDELSRDGTDDEEKEANLFAAELLMPAGFLERDIASLGGFSLLDEKVISGLAKQYGVSTQALSFRLAYLGYVEL